MPVRASSLSDQAAERDDSEDGAATDGAVASPPVPANPPRAAAQIFNVTANGETISGQEAFDTINDATFSNATIFSYQGGDSHTTINLGTGTNNTVVAHIFDTVSAGPGTDTIEEFQGHDNVFNLGDGNFSVTLSYNDKLTAGNGNNNVTLYSNATNDSIVLGNGNNSVAIGGQSGNFAIALGTGSDTLNFAFMTSGNLTVAQALGARPDVLDVSDSTLASVTATIANAGDVVVDDGSHIANLTLRVAVDGYKAPYEATVNYVATGEAIAAPYNTAQPLPYFIAGLLFDPAPRAGPARSGHRQRR